MKRRREVIELVLPPAQVVEHQYWERQCPRCRKRLTPTADLGEQVLGQMKTVAEEDMDKETSKRWRANFEYTQARLKSRLVYIYEYSYLLRATVPGRYTAPAPIARLSDDRVAGVGNTTTLTILAKR